MAAAVASESGAVGDIKPEVSRTCAPRKIFFLVLLVVGLLILNLIMILYFVTQNNMLREEVTKLEAPPFPAVQATASPSPQPSMTDWKTYTNSVLGYEIKYPNNLFGKETDSSQRFIISDIEKMGIQDVMPEEKIHVNISVMDNSEGLGLKDFLNKLMGTQANDLTAYSQNGMNGFKLELPYDSGSVSAGVTVFFAKAKQVYVLVGLNYNPNMRTESIDLMKEILSTFKFI